MAITLTDKAAERVRKFLANRGAAIGLRVGVKPAGCSGMAYVIEYVESVGSEDQVFEDKGVKLIVSGKDLAFLDGTQLDFARDGLNEGFKFNNPNVKNTCGCGESFTV